MRPLGSILKLIVLTAPVLILGSNVYDELLAYYSRENCESKGYMPKFGIEGYVGNTHFERLFMTPLALDLMTAAHSGNETGFEQVTANWGCQFEPCYGTGASGLGCESIGFFGPGAKDPAGGGCPRGPVKVYEDLTCAIKLGLRSDPHAFDHFCNRADPEMGMYECLAFFANVITETGSFAETEERDPRPYCWDRSPGNPNCCPAPDHQPCLPDSSSQLSAADYPQPHSRWLTDEAVPNKCCTYHGRGFLQVSYEPNYRAMSKALFDEEKVLWHYPYKLRSDGVMGWSAALWFWFNEHPAQIGNGANMQMEHVSPRSQIYQWQSGKGLPAVINVINGGECSGSMDTMKAMSRISYFHAIAHRMNAVPPTLPGEPSLDYYPLPGTADCNRIAFCRDQFHATNSVCPTFNGGLDCTVSPYIVNASTPMGFWRKTIKMTQIDGETPICTVRSRSVNTPSVWKEPQADFEPIDLWWEMLDIHRENICQYSKLFYPDPDRPFEFLEGESRYCREVCWKDFSWNLADRGQPCDEPQKPCKTLTEYVSHPLPRRGWESGDMGDYKGGAYLGRVGPGMVMAMNGEYGYPDTNDRLCFHFGATACHWNIGMGCHILDKNNIHGCRIFPPNVPDSLAMNTLRKDDEEEVLKDRERPQKMRDVLGYYDNCPEPTGKTILEQLFPRGATDMDFLFSAHYSQSDGFANRRYDTDELGDNVNSILHGFKGPQHVWQRMLCAFQLGIPSDPDFFQKHFGLRQSVNSRAEVPFPLTEDQRRFAQLEFIALAANMIKETGAMGQAEEQDPRCYCNNQGGAKNPCCPNDYGNNPACYTSTDSSNTNISPEEMKRGTTPLATCCTYHGRGFLQTSYEWNYGTLGALMLKSITKGVDEDLGRKFLVNYPQDIDPFGVTGWVATFAFWIEPHPCQYCQGRNSTTLDWNANLFSPHLAMVDYDVPGNGLGATFTIINGQECEASFTSETPIAMVGGGMRLSLFYNLAYRLKVKAPGESHILPLPGTTECDASPWCRGTFHETPVAVASYRAHSGGCWALTPQPVGGQNDNWPWCRADGFVTSASKYGAALDVLSFTMKKTSPTGCEMLHEFRCGYKHIDRNNKPSMLTDPQLVAYTEDHVITTDYDDPDFIRLQGLSLEVLCQYAVDTNPSNNMPPPNQDCTWWCLQPSGGGSCRAMNPETCAISASGANMVKCINDFYQSLHITNDCKIDVPGNISPENPPPSPPPPTPPPPSVCELCSDCVSTDGWNDAACKVCIQNPNGNNQWPCNQAGYCKCVGIPVPPPPPPTPCDATCRVCISISHRTEDDAHCAKCAFGENTLEWPCNGTQMCQCQPGSGGTAPTTTTTASTTTLTTTATVSTTTTATTTTTVTATTATTTSTTTVTATTATTTTTTVATTTATTTAAATTATTMSAPTTSVTMETTVAPATSPSTLAPGVGGIITRPSPADPKDRGCDECSLCMSQTGFVWDDVHCEKCSNGDNPNLWPCSIANDFCKCT